MTADDLDLVETDVLAEALRRRFELILLIGVRDVAPGAEMYHRSQGEVLRLLGMMRLAEAELLTHLQGEARESDDV